MLITVDSKSRDTTLPKHIVDEYRANSCDITIEVTKDNCLKTDEGYTIFKFLDGRTVTIESEDGFFVPISAIVKTAGQWR